MANTPMGKKVMIIGSGGVASVAAHKCAQAGAEVFDELLITSRNIGKCNALKERLLKTNTSTKIQTASVDAANTESLVALPATFVPLS